MKLVSHLWLLASAPLLFLIAGEEGRLTEGPRTLARGSQNAKVIEERERAPDGYRGFGETTLARATSIVLAKSKEDTAFIAHLRSLHRDLELFLALQTDALRESGAFDLAGLKNEVADGASRTPDVRDLLEVFYDRQEKAFQTSRFDEFTARIQSKTRLRLLGEVLILSEWDAGEIDDGLAFLLTHRVGWGDVTLEEAQRVAARIDRAAARARARWADVGLLFREDESKAWAEQEQALETALLTASKIENAEECAKAIDEVLSRGEKRAQALRGLLASTRMREQLAEEQALTEARVREAAESLPGLRALLPGTEEAQVAPQVVQNMSAQDRHGRLSFLSRANLGLDPLNAELNWLAGVAIDFMNGEQNALRYFDRYLALRGIRSGRGETHLKRKLTPEEQLALNEVQQAELPLPR